MAKSKSKFAGEAMEFPLFVGDVERLRSKFDTADGLLKGYWADLQRTFMQKQETRQQMIFLPALFSDELGAEAKGYLKNYYLSLLKSDNVNDIQFHTWCRCGSVMRRAAFFDWLASRGAFSQAEIEEAAECFLGFGFKHPFAVLTSRERSSNNQALSMALYLAVVGFLFGHKLTSHPTGKFLFDYGTGRLPNLIGLFPEDGYGGEGSTYTSHVNTPLAYWTCEFLKQVTGRSYLDTRFRANGTTLRKLLDIELRLISPGGLLAPWDHYGWQKGINASPFAYLARATGNPRYLSLIPSLKLWDDPGYLAWGQDDPMWTLIWWPEKHKGYAEPGLPAELFGWFLPKTGAALDDPARRARLMQVWDFSAGTVAGVGRAQVNPNHIMLDWGGEPVFQDGVHQQDKDPWNFPADKVFERLSEEERRRYLAYLGAIIGVRSDLRAVVVGSSPGLIGAANAVVVDEEPWYWPGDSRVGKGEFYAVSKGLQVVTADSAAFYQPHYDVRQARRTSIWCEAGFGVVLDTLRADSPHTWRWQVYLRPDVEVEGDTARVKLPDGRSVLLAWEPGCKVRTAMVEGFPRTQEMRSLRLDLIRKGDEARFAVVIAPGARTASISRVNDSLIEVKVNGRKHLMLAENFGRKTMSVADATTSAVFAWRAPGSSLVKITRGAVKGVKPDVYELPDVSIDRDLQLPAFRKLVRWDAEPLEAGETRLSQVDACIAQLVARQPDVRALIAALRSPHWPVQVAAAEVLGRRGCREAAPLMRKLLEVEHAIPREQLYPAEGAEPRDKTTEDVSKRWRLKAALIVALGKLGDRKAVPLLGRILADGRDFYTVYSVAAQALGRIGGRAALKALVPAFAESEVNTHSRAIFSKEAIERRARREK